MSGRRRSSFFSILERNKNADASDFKVPVTNNPFLKTQYEQIFILRETAASVQDRMKACDKISYSIYLGGGVVEPSMKKDSQLIDVVIKILMDDIEDSDVKLVIFPYSNNYRRHYNCSA